jgi:hypothetical protein
MDIKILPLGFTPQSILIQYYFPALKLVQYGNSMPNVYTHEYAVCVWRIKTKATDVIIRSFITPN